MLNRVVERCYKMDDAFSIETCRALGISISVAVKNTRFKLLLAIQDASASSAMKISDEFGSEFENGWKFSSNSTKTNLENLTSTN